MLRLLSVLRPDFFLFVFKFAFCNKRFGCSVSLDGRTIVIGAEQSDYGNKGTPFVETYDTDGLDNKYFGKGAAYIFHLQVVFLPKSSRLVC